MVYGRPRLAIFGTSAIVVFTWAHIPYSAVVNDLVMIGIKIRLLREIRIFVIPTKPILCINRTYSLI